MATELLSRAEMSAENTWALEDIYASKGDWEKDIEKINELADQIAEKEGKLASSAAKFYEVLKTLEELSIKISSVSVYAMNRFNEDTSNTEHQSMSAKSDSTCAQVYNKIAFLDPEILNIEQDVLEGFFAEIPELEKYRHYVNEVLRLKEYTLSSEMEKLLALSAEACGACSDTYSLLENADMTFPEVNDEEGNPIQLSHGRFVGMLTSPSREVRENTFKGYYSSYKKLINTFASLYGGQVKRLIFNAKARGYKNTLEAAVIANDVTPSVYHNLVSAVNENIDALHDYVSLRKQLLGVEELHMYDIYVPMISGVQKKVAFEEAKATVLKALVPLGEDYTNVIQEGFNNRWIDVYENKGKRSGAYEVAAYGYHPFVLLNYDEKLDDMFTLIHEMGHAMHSYYSDKANPYFESQYKIFVAEVASTCNELLLLDYLIKNTEDVDEKKYLLNHYLDMFKGTLFRQTQFAEFEMLTNRMVEDGESLNAENLSSLYKELNEKYYGPDMISDDEIALEWARIPHFYYNFYVYQYATSFSASVAISKKLLSGDKAALEGYKKFLSSGCTKAPVELLKDVGVNLETSAPFAAAIDVMRDVIRQLKELTGK